MLQYFVTLVLKVVLVVKNNNMKVVNKTIIITDPCYIIKDDNRDDWKKCEYGENMKKLGFHNYIVTPTKVGDWSCTTFNSAGESIGTFTADAGLVGVFELDEILKYNQAFIDLIPKKCYTVIGHFDGIISVENKDYGVSITGDGNIEFHTEQTGW